MNRKMLQSPNIYALFLKSWGFKDVKYDIFPCVNPIQLVPTMKKALYVFISSEIPENKSCWRKH